MPEATQCERPSPKSSHLAQRAHEPRKILEVAEEAEHGRQRDAARRTRSGDVPRGGACRRDAAPRPWACSRRCRRARVRRAWRAFPPWSAEVGRRPGLRQRRRAAMTERASRGRGSVVMAREGARGVPARPAPALQPLGRPLHARERVGGRFTDRGEVTHLAAGARAVLAVEEQPRARAPRAPPRNRASDPPPRDRRAGSRSPRDAPAPARRAEDRTPLERAARTDWSDTPARRRDTSCAGAAPAR